MSQEARIIAGLAGIAQQLARCTHQRTEPVDGGAHWCIDCGTYFPKSGAVDSRHPAWRTMAILIDPGPEPTEPT